MTNIKSIAVIGSGTMGNGIAHVFALKGFQVHLHDIADEALQRAMATIEQNLSRQLAKGSISEADKAGTLERITTTSHLEQALQQAEVVVEAATENKALKLELFRKLDALAPAGTILASNTSSISVTSLAAATRRPEQVIGMHFMNPVPVMPLVEVIQGYATSRETADTIMQLSGQLEKTPLLVQDYPGFIANRILMPMINEAIYALHEGVAGVEAIDRIMQLGMAHPMGPLRLADFIGLDVCLSILEVLHEGFKQAKYAACPLLVNMVAAGKLGMKSGEGFYDYRKNKKEPGVALRFSNGGY